MSTPNWLRRFAWLLLMSGLLAWPVANSLHRVQQTHRVRTLLLTVQRALQDYHVDQERYVPRPQLRCAALIAVLAAFGFLKPLPLNPWTGAPWKLDGNEPDHLRYASDAEFRTYALRSLDPKTGKVLLEIDSVHHPSLE